MKAKLLVERLRHKSTCAAKHSELFQSVLMFASLMISVRVFLSI